MSILGPRLLGFMAIDGKNLPPINLKQQRLVEELTNVDPRTRPKSVKEAMVRAGYSMVTADAQAGRALRAPGVRERLERAKRPKSEIELLTRGGNELIQKSVSGAAKTEDPILMANVGATALKAASLLRESGLVKEDTDSDVAALEKYRLKLAKVASRAARWAANGNERAFRLYFHFLGVEVPE